MIIKLNVGGKRFQVSRFTLSEFPECLIQKLFTDSLSIDEDIFIDRDGTLFGYILEYLRTKNVFVKDRTLLMKLKMEADFFLLNELVGLIQNMLQNIPMHHGKFKNVMKNRVVEKRCRRCIQYNLFPISDFNWNNNSHFDINNQQCNCYVIQEQLVVQEWTCCGNANPNDLECIQ
jgi:hypothetical protein